jgi:N-acetyl-gamma-glutamyl-phosphate reductase
MSPKVFIDGEAGTTGLQIADRLRQRADLDLVSIDPARRKDIDERARLMNMADAVILCLPDDAARLGVSLVTSKNTVIIDASTAHRTAAGWTYGFPEMDKGQRAAIQASTRISNPGCYPTGAIALVRPLVDAGLLPQDFALTVNAVSGYSGGGRSMIEGFESPAAAEPIHEAFFLYGLGLKHKHLPELQHYSRLTHRPLFVPSVGKFRQGMLVSVPLQLWALPGTPSPAALHEALCAHYDDQEFVRVASLAESGALARLDPEAVNGSNEMRLFVFADAAGDQALLVAQLDNLGKGASGAAVQCLNLMIGQQPAAGLREKLVA